jgi:hypothetical protein
MVPVFVLILFKLDKMLLRLTATRAILNAKSPIFRSCGVLPGEPAIVITLSQLSPFSNLQDSLG